MLLQLILGKSLVGGTTEFANTYAAFADLPPSEQAALEGLKVVHMFETSQRYVNPEPDYATVRDWQRFAPATIPLVWKHKSGRKSLVLGMTVAENLALTSLASQETMGGAARFGLVDAASESLLADRRIRSLQIRGDAASTASTLSGGNQQKVVLGKWLATSPKVLIIDEPTRGIDVGAKAEVYGALAELVREGMAVLMISSELPEVLGMADRVLVMHEGRITADIARAEANEERIMGAALGQSTVILGHAA